MNHYRRSLISRPSSISRVNRIRVRESTEDRNDAVCLGNAWISVSLHKEDLRDCLEIHVWVHRLHWGQSIECFINKNLLDKDARQNKHAAASKKSSSLVASVGVNLTQSKISANQQLLSCFRGQNHLKLLCIYPYKFQFMSILKCAITLPTNEPTSNQQNNLVYCIKLICLYSMSFIVN